MLCHQYDVDVDDNTISQNLERIRNQVYRLLPVREEGKEWRKPLETLIVELLGMSSLFPEQKDLLSVVSKLEGLRVSTNEEIDFMLYRRTIFEACGLINKIKERCE